MCVSEKLIKHMCHWKPTNPTIGPKQTWRKTPSMSLLGWSARAGLRRKCLFMTKADMTEFREIFAVSALLETTLDQSVSAFAGGAYTAK